MKTDRLGWQERSLMVVSRLSRLLHLPSTKITDEWPFRKKPEYGKNGEGIYFREVTGQSLSNRIFPPEI